MVSREYYGNYILKNDKKPICIEVYYILIAIPPPTGRRCASMHHTFELVVLVIIVAATQISIPRKKQKYPT